MIRLKKSLGQNLLTDRNILNKIISLSYLNQKNVIEIGPGTGNLTKEIIKNNPKNLLLIEKDKNLIFDLNLLTKNKNVSIINEDILKLDLEKLIKKKQLY